MDKFWTPFLSILLLLHQTMSTTDPEGLIKAVGESVIFSIHDTTDGNAFWNFGNESIVAVSFEDPSKVIFSEKFEKRSVVLEKGRALNISQLTLEDAGIYSVNINGKISTFVLHVYNQLVEPEVTCEAQNCSGGSCRFSLRCSTPGNHLGQVSYTWRVGDRPWGDGPVVLWVNKSLEKEQEQEEEEEEELVTCMAQNPVSSRNVTVTTPGVLCAETSRHLPGALSSRGVRIGIVVGIGILVISLALLVLLFSWKSRGWKKFPLSKSKPTDTEDSKTVYAEVGPARQCISNGIKAKPADGKSVTTVYSMVKRSEQVDDGTAEKATMSGLGLV